MNTAVYSITDFAPHYHNVHILTDGIYAGVGRFCDSYEEMIEYCKSYNVVRLDHEGGAHDAIYFHEEGRIEYETKVLIEAIKRFWKREGIDGESLEDTGVNGFHEFELFSVYEDVGKSSKPRMWVYITNYNDEKVYDLAIKEFDREGKTTFEDWRGFDYFDDLIAWIDHVSGERLIDNRLYAETTDWEERFR